MFADCHFSQPEGLRHASPGQRSGLGSVIDEALSVRHHCQWRFVSPRQGYTRVARVNPGVALGWFVGAPLALKTAALVRLAFHKT